MVSRSYLSERTQFVQIAEYRSTHGKIPCGVPQGSKDRYCSYYTSMIYTDHVTVIYSLLQTTLLCLCLIAT